MPFTNFGRNTALNAIGAAATYIGFHTADPGTQGTSEVSAQVYNRGQTAWSAASSGSMVGTAVNPTIPAGLRLTHWSLWTGPTGGNFVCSFPLPAPEDFGSQGTIVFTPTLAATG